MWDSIEHNPWAALPALELRERGLAAPPAPGTPGPFALGEPGRLRELLEQAGFAEIDVQGIAVEQRHPSFDAFWETTLDIARAFHDAVLSRPETEITAIHDALAARLAPYTEPDGALAIPGRTLVASATA